ncbi:MAG: hypothetical protein AB7I27_15805 [Bacteriovoracaceae bacterium]
MLKILASTKSLIIISAIGIGTSLVVLYRSTNGHLVKYDSSEPIAMVIQPKNDIRVKQSGTLHWSHLKEPVPARSGDSIFAGENSSTKIVLKKGSEIILMPHSLVVVQDNVLDLETGSLKINLKPEEKITELKVAGKIVKLSKPGTLTVKQVGKEIKVDLVPEKGGPAIDLLKTEAVVELKEESGEILLTDIQSSSNPEQEPVESEPIVAEAIPEAIPEPTPEPKEVIKPVAEVAAPEAITPTPTAKPKAEPKIDVEVAATEPPKALDKIEPAPLPPKKEVIKPPKKYDFYYFLAQTSQSHQVSLNGTANNSSKDYSINGLTHQVRIEAENLLLKPVALTLGYNDLSSSTASYKGIEAGFEVIFKSPIKSLPHIELIPGAYYRNYSLGLKDLITGGSESSSAASSSAMASMMVRWRRDFNLWTAEIWPLLKAHQKDKLLIDYHLFSAFGRNTDYGRFSFFHKWINNQDTLGYSQGSDTNASVKTKENRFGLMYLRGF